VLNLDKPEKSSAKKSGEPKIAKGNPNYRLLPSTCCAKANRSQKLDEDELKQRRARLKRNALNLTCRAA